MPRCGATADENHVAQTALSAVCGFSSPNCTKAADLPEMREVCATRSYFHRSHCGAAGHSLEASIALVTRLGTQRPDRC